MRMSKSERAFWILVLCVVMISCSILFVGNEPTEVQTKPEEVFNRFYIDIDTNPTHWMGIHLPLISLLDGVCYD